MPLACNISFVSDFELGHVKKKTKIVQNVDTLQIFPNVGTSHVTLVKILKIDLLHFLIILNECLFK